MMRLVGTWFKDGVVMPPLSQNEYGLCTGTGAVGLKVCERPCGDIPDNLQELLRGKLAVDFSILRQLFQQFPSAKCALPGKMKSLILKAKRQVRRRQLAMRRLI
jgi:hypothetical protein